MKFLYNLSIKAKITAIIASVSLFAIILGFSILTINNITNLKKDLVKQNTLTAKLLSQYLLYALIFEDTESAIDQLDKLNALSFIKNAEVYNADGQLLASYQNIPASNKVLLQKESSANYINNELHIIEPVWNKGEFLGTIFLRVSTNSLAQKVKEYILVLIVTGGIISLFIILMANSFQKIISRPILRLASSIEKIAESKDFSIRVHKIFDDEVGTLYDGVNNMLEQIVKRDIDTLRAQEALKESQELFSTFMEVLPAAAYVKNADSTYRFVNQFLINKLGAKDWIGKSIFKNYPNHETDKKRDELALKELLNFENSVYNAENKLMYFENWKFPIHRKGKPTLIGGIAIDISKRKIAERKIQYYIHELERNNKELEEFNYVASHDLREPLRTITSYCDLLREDLNDKVSNDVSEDLNFITDAATRMNILIQDLLQLSRAGRVDFSREAVDLNHIIQNVKADLNLKIKETHATFIVDQLPVVQGDAVQLNRVFQNLITNALKFKSDKDPIIEIKSESKNGFVEITVSDNGIGMDEQYFTMIFAPFKRLHSRDKFEGTGIGLAICKKIIDRHSGSINVKSDIGKGTSFIISLEEYKENIKK